MVKVYIDGNELRQNEKNGGVCGEGNSTEMLLSFGADWEKYTKKIVFYNALGLNPVEVLLGEVNRTGTEDGRDVFVIKIPAEPLEFEGKAAYVVDGTLENARKKSVEGDLKVRYAPSSKGGAVPEDVAASVGEQLQQEADKVALMIKNAAPYIGDNGNWFRYDAETATYIDTGIQAQGEKGDTGAQGIQGEKGEKGETGAQGPQGIQGEKGDTGAQGPQGVQGEPGYTPQRGTDYWTPIDIKEINDDVNKLLFEGSSEMEEVSPTNYYDIYSNVNPDEDVCDLPHYFCFSQIKSCLVFELGGKLEDNLGQVVEIKYDASVGEEEFNTEMFLGTGFYSPLRNEMYYATEEKLDLIYSEESSEYSGEFYFPEKDESGFDDSVAVVYFRYDMDNDIDKYIDVMLYSLRRTKTVDSLFDKVAGAVPFVITGSMEYNLDSYAYEFKNMSATYEEIKAAYEQGKDVILKITHEERTSYINLSFIDAEGDMLYFIGYTYAHSSYGSLNYNVDITDVQLFIQCESNDSWRADGYPLASLSDVDDLIGDMNNLTTKNKTNLVAAINEVDAAVKKNSPLEVIISATTTDDEFTLYPPGQTYAEIVAALQWETYNSDYKGVKARFENDADGWAIDLPNVQCGDGDDNSPIVFSGTYGQNAWSFSITYDNKWSYSVKTFADKDYVDTQIGDIETALDNIIAKYGLGGDAV